MAKMLSYQVIEKARPLVANANTWTTGAIARGSDGASVDFWSKLAVRFCAYGALLRTAFDLVGNTKDAENIARSAAAVLTGAITPQPDLGALYAVNDTNGQQAVLDLFDRALGRHEVVEIVVPNSAAVMAAVA